MNASLPFRNPALHLETRVSDLVERLTLDEKVRMLHQFQPEIGRLGVAAYKHGTEAAHGISWLGPATAFPQPTGLASTWDPELLEKVGTAIGEEARGFFRRKPQLNGLTLWAPTVDMQRDPRWGRTEEAYGEDPLLTAETAGALVRGIQGSHPTYLRAAATLKHFLGNNHEADRGSVSVTLDPRNLNEYYHRPFERIFRKSGAVSMMTAYNAVNGVPCNLNPEVRTKAKQDWGCAFVVSDAGDVVGTNKDHRWFKTMAEAVAANLKAGVDSFTDDAGICLTAVHEALGLGLISEADVEEAVRNSLRVRFRFGEFDPAGLNPYEALGEEQIGSDAHRKLSRITAEKAIVLLQNDGTLPLRSGAGNLAVVGPLADVLIRDWYSGEATHQATVASAMKTAWKGSVTVESGSDTVRLLGKTYQMVDWGWSSHTFQDTSTGLYLTTTDDKAFAATARESFGWFTKEVFLVEREGSRAVMASWNGLPLRETDGKLEALALDTIPAGRIGIDGSAATEAHLAAVKELCTPISLEVAASGLERAVASARGAEAAIVVVGCHPVINAKETLDRTTIDLPASQIALVRAVAAVNPKTIVIVVSGYPYALDGILDVANAVIHSTHGGPEAPVALARVVMGEVNPAGRTNQTWYARHEALPPLTDYDIMRSGRTYRWFSGAPQFPFGHGLSYSQFEYLELQAAATAGGFRILVRLTNTSDRAGEEVVQVYASVQGTVPHPRRQLMAFRRVPFAAQESKTVEFAVPVEDLQHWDPARSRWTLDAGQVVLAAGPSSGDLRVSAPFPLAGESPANRDLRRPIRAADWDDHQAGVLEFCREGGAAATFAWAAYHRCEFTQGVPKALELRVSSREGGDITLRLNRPDGTVVARIAVAASRPAEVWRTLIVPVEGWVPGVPTSLYLVSTLKTGREEGISWFRVL